MSTHLPGGSLWAAVVAILLAAAAGCGVGASGVASPERQPAESSAPIVAYAMNGAGSVITVTGEAPGQLRPGPVVIPVRCPDPSWQPMTRTGDLVIALHDVETCPGTEHGTSCACPAQAGPPPVWLLDMDTGQTREVDSRLTQVVALDAGHVSGVVTGGPDAGAVAIVDVDGSRPQVVYRPGAGEQIAEIVVGNDGRSLFVAIAGVHPRVDHVSLSGVVTASSPLDIDLPAGRDVYLARSGGFAVAWDGTQDVAVDNLEAHRVHLVRVPSVPRDGGAMALGLSADGRYALVARRNVDDQRALYLLNTTTRKLERQPNIDSLHEIVL